MHDIYTVYSVSRPSNLFYITHAGYHAFEVSIQTFNSLPVIGEDFTLVCAFIPNTWNRQVIWAKGSTANIASHSCRSYHQCTESIPHPSKFSLVADSSSGNLTIKNLTVDDESNYICSVSGTYGPVHPALASMQVTPLTPGKYKVFTSRIQY